MLSQKCRRPRYTPFCRMHLLISILLLPSFENERHFKVLAHKLKNLSVTFMKIGQKITPSISLYKHFEPFTRKLWIPAAL